MLTFEEYINQFHPGMPESAWSAYQTEYDAWVAAGGLNPTDPEPPTEPETPTEPDPGTDTMTFAQWMAENYPGEGTTLGTLGFRAYQRRRSEYNTFIAGDGGDGGLSADQIAWNAYQAGGGTLIFTDWVELKNSSPSADEILGSADFAAWMATNHPGTPQEAWTSFVSEYSGLVGFTIVDVETDLETETAGGVVYQNEAGYWVHDLNDTIWSSEADAMADYNSTLQSQGFQQELATSVEEYEADIERLGGEQAAEAKRLSARNVGRMSREMRNALLAQGRTPEEIAQLSAGGLEGSQRSLNDLLQQMSLSTQEQLAGASQFGIGTQLTAESLGQAQQRISAGQTQFGQSLAESVRQFNLSQGQQAGQFAQSLAQQQGQFTAGLGFSQQELAQQASQFGQQFGQRQKETGFFGSQGFLANTLGNIGFYF